jgi:hypothetical protein
VNAKHSNHNALDRIWPLRIFGDFPGWGFPARGILQPVTSTRRNASTARLRAQCSYCYPILTETGLCRHILVTRTNMMVVMMMIMLMGWDYVSELRPPTGLFYPPRLYISMENHGGVMVSTEKTPDLYTRALLKSYQQRHVVANRRNGWRECCICRCEVFLFIPASDIIIINAVKSYNMGPLPLIIPIRRKASWRSWSPLQIYRLGRA